ncbi:MAG TPA: biliverdin-producing heme oxygenase [Acetobacteraceae bacterium]|jgi:heme oxygenase|nr:biliverdin-producing heme oxygenase [Acetobacteraceae bacterium]
MVLHSAAAAPAQALACAFLGRSRATLASPLSHRLREGTAAAHARAEMGMWPESATSDPATYARWLSRHLGLIAPFEVVIETHAAFLAALGADPLPRARRGLLRRDLAMLGMPEECPAPAPPLTGAEALGALYVLEGSRLGGRVLLRRVEDKMPGLAATAFLAGADAVPGAWRALRGALDGFGEHAGPEAVAAVLRGADATFQAFEAWFAPLAQPAGAPG